MILRVRRQREKKIHEILSERRPLVHCNSLQQLRGLGGNRSPVCVSASLHNTEYMASLGEDPGPWTTWGHDTLSDSGPRDGWQASQGKVVCEDQTARARELRGGLGLSAWACWKRRSRGSSLQDLGRKECGICAGGKCFRQKEQQEVQGLLATLPRYCCF